MTESLFTDDFDLSTLISDFTEFTEDPETNSVRSRFHFSAASISEPARKKKRLNDEL
jgi:hypothetical protein